MSSRRLVIALLVPSVLACADDATSGVVGEDAGLRVINATQTRVDVIVDGTVATSGLGVATVSQTITVPAGLHDVQLRAANGSTASLQALADAGSTLTAIATPAGGGVAASVLVDTGSVVPAGKSKLRLVHLAPNAPPVESWRTQPDFQTPVHVVTPFLYGTTTPYLQSDPGAWEVWVTATGALATQKLATTGAVQVPSGERRTVVLLDSAGTLRMRVVAE